MDLFSEWFAQDAEVNSDTFRQLLRHSMGFPEFCPFGEHLVVRFDTAAH